MDRYRNLVFTLNNYSDEEYTNLLNCDLFKYVIIGKEKGEKGTPHLQGYAELNKETGFKKIKSVNNRMYFDRRRGSQKQAIDYCMKDGVYEERGNRRVQGERTDLRLIRDSIERGASYRELLRTYELNSGQLRVIDRYFSYLEPEFSI